MLVDADNDDCRDLKAKMVDLLNYCKPPPTLFFRIAVEETEAFYLGDISAIRKAYPSVKVGFLKNYVQDSICGTWELFRDAIGEQDENKVRWAENMGEVLGTTWRGRDANKSQSFIHLCRALRILVGGPVD